VIQVALDRNTGNFGIFGPEYSPASATKRQPDLPGSVPFDAFGEALEVRSQIAQVLFDRGRRSVAGQNAKPGTLGDGSGPAAPIG
jgi:hypothetical protein